MKKKLLLILLMLVSVFAFAQEEVVAEEAAGERQSYNIFLYPLTEDEMEYFIKSWNWLKAWEAGQVEYSDKQFELLYEDQIGQEYFTAMLFENFFMNTKNPKIQKQLKKYIKKNKLGDRTYEKALLKKLDSKPQTWEQSTSTETNQFIQYVYNDSEYDENINFFDFDEVRPFDDEFGLILFNNDWAVLTVRNIETDELVDDRKILLMFGGGTNCITITLQEYLNVESVDAVTELANIASFEKKYEDNWKFLELPKEGILERCGADNIFVGIGIGDESMDGDVLSLLYRKDLQKAYKVSFYMNYSESNINYENRARLYNYLLFFATFAFAD